MTPTPFPIGTRVKGPGYSGEVVEIRGPYSVTVRLDATGRNLIVTTTEMEHMDVPRARTLD